MRFRFAVSLTILVLSGVSEAQSCPPNYCVPHTVECCSNTGTPKEYVSNVTLANINYSTNYGLNCPGVSGYWNYTGTPAAVLSAGASYPISVRATVPSFPQCAAFTPLARGWIDWNSNGVFEAGETINLTQNLGQPTLHTGTVTVPVGAADHTRLRVGVAWPGAPGPCNTNQNGGSFQDFAVVVTGNTTPVNLCPYGSGLPGSGGTPVVWGNGTPLLGAAGFSITLTSAASSSPAICGLGAGPGSLPLFGGTLLLDPMQPLVPASAVTTTAGNSMTPLPIPANPALNGSSVYSQWFVLDAAAAQGWSMTGGLRVVLRT